MANAIKDIADEASLKEFAECSFALIVLTPRWSAYPKVVLQRVQEILPTLIDRKISVFTVTEDDVAENPHFMDWMRRHDRELGSSLRLIATGAGSIVICKKGLPFSIELTPVPLTTQELKERILGAVEQELN